MRSQLAGVRAIGAARLRKIRRVEAASSSTLPSRVCDTYSQRHPCSAGSQLQTSPHAHAVGTAVAGEAHAHDWQAQTVQPQVPATSKDEFLMSVSKSLGCVSNRLLPPIDGYTIRPPTVGGSSPAIRDGMENESSEHFQINGQIHGQIHRTRRRA